MRASGYRNNDSHCLRCLLRREICICPILPKVQTKVQFLILRHIREAGRPSNTGRLAALALPNSQIIPCGGGTRIGGESFDGEALLKPGTWLLWPDGPGEPFDRMTQAPVDRVVVVDATWHQARRIWSKMTALRALPRLVLPTPIRERDRLRDQHRPDGMSTLEAIAAAVAQLEGPRVAYPLEKLYDEVVRRTTALRWGVSTSGSLRRE